MVKSGDANKYKGIQEQSEDQHADIPMVDQPTGEDEAGIGCPSMNAKEKAEYMSRLQNQFKGKNHRLFGKLAGQ